MIIAVDGPAASGKGTIARALAKHYGLPHMDTGLLYRAVALNLWRWGGDPASEFEALRACDSLNIDPDDEELRSEPVSRIASAISAYPPVRAARPPASGRHAHRASCSSRRSSGCRPAARTSGQYTTPAGRAPPTRCPCHQPWSA